MKIKTITCHDVYNHGASLQAYALQQFLIGQGHNVEIINYKPDYLSNHYKLSLISNNRYKRFPLNIIYLLLKLPGRLNSLKRKKAFDRFTQKYLTLTPKRYNSNEQLKTDCPQADLYIAGSDQIWNTLFKNGRDAAFYLDFAPRKRLRISYAASFATNSIAPGYEDFVKNMIQSLDHISVREKQALKLLESMQISRAKAVCDPVFLLEKKAWNAVSAKPNAEKFVLVYDFEKSEVIKEIAIAIANKKKLRIFSVSPFRLDYADKNFNFSGPAEFLSLIRSAEYIISNSFHGTAFSLIYEKDFCVVNRAEGINSRMKDLLTELGLEERLVSAYSDNLTHKINYKTVNSVLKEQIQCSKNYLLDILNQ